MSRALSTALLGLALAAQVGAQQQQATPPKDRQQVVRERLRTMGREAPRDTVTNPDSIRARAQRARADSAAARPRPVAPVELQRDSLMLALARLQGFTATEYKAASARFVADSGMLVLQARPDTQAAVVQGGQSMVADSLLTYDRNSAIACGFGKPVLTGEGADSPVKSEQVCYNTRTRVGKATDATTNVSEGGGNWVMFGNLTTSSTDLYIDHARFTDCTLEVPHYHFSASEGKVVNKDVIVARNVTLKFGDVPVFWLPFFMQSLKKGRRSGLLMPEFSVNDIVRRNSGYNRRISNLGFYWAASEYMGAKVSYGWFADNWMSLDGGLDYRFSDKFLGGSVNWREYWPAEGGRQRTVSANTSWQPDERTSLNANVGYASQSRFVRQSTFDPRELNRSIDSNLGLTRRFDWAQISMGGQRQQRLSDESVDWAAPGLNISFAPLSFFNNNATWTASAGTAFRRHTNEESVVPEGFDRDELSGNASSSFSLGNFSWSQGINFRKATQFERPSYIVQKEEGADTVPVEKALIQQQMDWNTGLSFQQRLIGTSTLTPGISLSGVTARDSATGMMVSGPMRMSANAGVKVDLFGFWPGVGPLERLRHRLSPSFSYSYSPATKPTPVQERVFGPNEIREQNRLTIGLSQTIEGKFREDKTPKDSAAVDTTSTSGEPGEPRRLQQSRRIQLLSLQTDAVAYDFVEAREGYGIQTTQITNSINSELLRGLQLSVTHDLFRELALPDSAPAGLRPERVWSPYLSQVNASFSLNSSSWLFRILGLGRSAEAKPAVDSSAINPPPNAPNQPPGITPVGGPDLGMFGTSGQRTAQVPRSPAGSWNASFNYTLLRSRAARDEGNQMVTGNVMFQPTANWNVTWNTGYSFTQKRFTDHVLTLTRAMHDWDANFNFVKAQNGNFSFVFHVSLRANPDLKFDYQQRSNSIGQPIR
jgi:hypothetical protein